MSINVLPCIAEDTEADSTVRNTEHDLTVSVKHDVSYTPINEQQLLPENQKPHSPASFNKYSGIEETVSSSSKKVLSSKTKKIVSDATEVSHKENISTTCSDRNNNNNNNNNNNISKYRRVQSAESSRKASPWVIKLTKKEIEALLPRRSHFSCHDKALREAGFISEELKTRKFERTERRKIFRNKLLEAHNGTNNFENSTSNNGETPLSSEELNGDSSDSGVKGKSTFRFRKKQEDLQKVEHKALTEYLKYVKENTNEYLEHLSRRQTSYENLAVRHLIKTAMIFQRGHHGVPYTSPTVRASHTLNTRFADPGLWQQLNREAASKRLIRKESTISKLTTEKEKDTKADSDEPKTDYERVLSRAERWAKTVSTAQFLRARQEALKEVEEEDVDVTKWWITMKNCGYIRRAHTSILD